jgi:hypothetical protein
MSAARGPATRLKADPPRDSGSRRRDPARPARPPVSGGPSDTAGQVTVVVRRYHPPQASVSHDRVEGIEDAVLLEVIDGRPAYWLAGRLFWLRQGHGPRDRPEIPPLPPFSTPKPARAPAPDGAARATGPRHSLSTKACVRAGASRMAAARGARKP